MVGRIVELGMLAPKWEAIEAAAAARFWKASYTIERLITWYWTQFSEATPEAHRGKIHQMPANGLSALCSHYK